MSTAVLAILTAFDALPDAEKDAVVAELLARRPVGVGSSPDAAFEELAEERFLAYDAGEAADTRKNSRHR